MVKNVLRDISLRILHHQGNTLLLIGRELPNSGNKLPPNGKLKSYSPWPPFHLNSAGKPVKLLSGGVDMINSISIAGLYSAYSTDVGSRDATSPASAGLKKQETTQAGSPTTIVNLSKEAIDALEKDKASRAVDQVLANQGRELYEVAVKSLKQYPEDIASRFSDKTLSEEELTKLGNALTDREMNAFTKYARQTPPDMKMYFQSYIEYLDTLSPEELQSERYAGQREVAVMQYEYFARAQGDEPDDMSSSQDPILSLFDLLAEADFNIKDRDNFIKTYEEKMANILDREGNEKLTPLVGNALERLNMISDVIAAGRDGDSIALEKLKSLASKEISVDEFSGYVKEVPQQNSMLVKSSIISN